MQRIYRGQGLRVKIKFIVDSEHDPIICGAYITSDGAVVVLIVQPGSADEAEPTGECVSYPSWSFG